MESDATDQAMRGVYLIIVLVMVGSALLARRVPVRGVIGMVLAWVAIFGVVLTLFSFRRELGLVAARVQTEVVGAPVQTVQGQTMRIAVAGDGHYWVDGRINGTSARFLIDSGASVTALSEETAKAAGLNVDRDAMPLIMQTANGKVEAWRSNIGTLEIGPVRASDLAVVVSPAFGPVNVIGMNMLSRLKSWGVQGGEMVLTP
jgi:aspartyl protease family protein